LRAIPAPKPARPASSKSRRSRQSSERFLPPAEPARSNRSNAILPEFAKEAGTNFVALPAVPEHLTTDDIRLNAAGHAGWDRGDLAGIDVAICESA
jgi:hypothetical protein